MVSAAARIAILTQVFAALFFLVAVSILAILCCLVEEAALRHSTPAEHLPHHTGPKLGGRFNHSAPLSHGHEKTLTTVAAISELVLVFVQSGISGITLELLAAV